MKVLSRRHLMPLYRHEVFRSRLEEEICTRVASELKAHSNTWGQGALDAAFCSVTLDAITLSILRYGREVSIEPDVFDEFVLVQTPLHGHAYVESEGQSLRIDPRCAAVISAHQRVKLHWSADCEQLIMKIPLSRLHEVASRAFGACVAPAGSDIEFDPCLRLDTEVGRQLCHLVGSLVSLLPSLSNQSHDVRWLAHYEENLILYLLCHQPNSVRRRFDAGQQRVDNARLNRLHIAEEYIADRLADPLNADDIARAAGVSRRALNELFREYRRVPVLTALRNMRLDAARAQLARHDAGTVTEIALNCGFSHLSRFAAYYQDRFNELPHVTWREAAL
jgi:AraC-like DNA-binding protein